MDTPCRAPLPVGNTASASCDQYSPGIVPEHPERLESSEHSMLHQLTNRPVPENILRFYPSAPCIRPEKRQRTDHGVRWYSLIRRACRRSRWAIRQKTRQSYTLDIASLNVENVKTNLNFVKCLSSRFPSIFPQETWLYRYQASTLTDN